MIFTRYTVLAGLLLGSWASASTIVPSDPAAGGISYKNTVTMGGEDSATFQNHVGAWSWEDNSLVTPENPHVGWTHTSNWTALELTQAAYLTVRMQRKAGVLWPAAGDPTRTAPTTSMFPSFTLWKNWDNDLAPQSFADTYNEGAPLDDFHMYNNRGDVAWAEDLQYVAHVDNSTSDFVERTYILPAGKYSIVQGSNAPATDSNRQGYEAVFTTSPYLPPVVNDESYFAASHIGSLSIAAVDGVLANDLNVETNYTIELVKPASYGTVTLNEDGSFTYVPGVYFGENGFDTFTYKMVPLAENMEAAGPATVTISTFSAAAGAYTGLLFGPEEQGIKGMAQLQVTPSGTYTGSTWIEGKRYGVSGAVDATGRVTVKSKPALATADLHLQAAAGRRHFVAKLGSTEGQIEQSPFSRYSAAPMAGKHAVTLTPVNPEGTVPTGLGQGTLKIASNGGATFIGKLGDKTPFSISSALIVGTNSGPTLPIYSPLYKKSLGSLGGQLTFGAVAGADATGVVTVRKPVQKGGPFSGGFTLDYAASTTKIPSPVRSGR